MIDDSGDVPRHMKKSWVKESEKLELFVDRTGTFARLKFWAWLQPRNPKGLRVSLENADAGMLLIVQTTIEAAFPMKEKPTVSLRLAPKHDAIDVDLQSSVIIELARCGFVMFINRKPVHLKALLSNGAEISFRRLTRMKTKAFSRGVLVKGWLGAEFLSKCGGKISGFSLGQDGGQSFTILDFDSKKAEATCIRMCQEQGMNAISFYAGMDRKERRKMDKIAQ